MMIMMTKLYKLEKLLIFYNKTCSEYSNWITSGFKKSHIEPGGQLIFGTIVFSDKLCYQT